MNIIRPTKITEAMIVAYGLPETDYPAFVTGTAYAKGDRCISLTTHRVFESLRGARSTVTITNATPAVVSWTEHGLTTNTKVRFTTTSALPTGLVVGTDYYVSATNLTINSFCVSLTAGGALINTTSAGAGVHTALEVINLGFDPDVAANTARGSKVSATTMWLEVGSTNKWRIFDQRSTEQTTANNSISVTFKPGRCAAVALINVDAADYTITMTDPIEGVVYTRSESLVLDNVFSWKDYFFEPIVRKTDVVIDDLPMYANAEVTVTLNATGGVAKLGELVVGLTATLGDSQWGAKVGGTSFSRKEVDQYSNASLEKGKYSRRLSVDMFVSNLLVDETRRKLESYDATALVWYASKQFSSTINYGFYRDFDVVLQSPAGSFCSVEIEGLT